MSHPADLDIVFIRPKFTEEKHYLGLLCIRRHDYEGTGKSWRHRGHDNCVECTRERARSWRLENPERAAANTRRRDRLRVANGANRGLRTRYPFAIHLGGVAKRARDKNLPFDLTPNDMRRLWIEQNGLCFWTGLTLDFFVGKDRDARRPSIDRLVPERGYCLGNVVWASNFANRARGDLSPPEFLGLLQTLGIHHRTCL